MLEHIVKVPPADEVEANVLALVHVAATCDMPLIITTNEERQNGALLPSLEPVHPAAYARRIER